MVKKVIVKMAPSLILQMFILYVAYVLYLTFLRNKTWIEEWMDHVTVINEGIYR